MMTEENIIQAFTALCRGEFSAEEWVKWITENAQSVENSCGKRYFLKIKPKESFSHKRNAYLGQTAFFQWLNTKNISVSLSDIYQKQYEEEFESFCQEQKEKEQTLKQTLISQFGYLKDIYPQLFRRLTQTFGETYQIEKGKTAEEIQQKETELGVRFSQELNAFFQHIGAMKLEGVAIDFEAMEKQTINEREYLVLGEFWQYADGDTLLYDVENHCIVVFSHEHRPSRAITQSSTMTDFVEKTLFQYLKPL